MDWWGLGKPSRSLQGPCKASGPFYKALRSFKKASKWPLAIALHKLGGSSSWQSCFLQTKRTHVTAYNQIPSLCTCTENLFWVVRLYVHRNQIPWYSHHCQRLDFTWDIELCVYGITIHIEFKVACISSSSWFHYWYLCYSLFQDQLVLLMTCVREVATRWSGLYARIKLCDYI